MITQQLNGMCLKVKHLHKNKLMMQLSKLKADEIAEAEAKAAQRQAILDRLGLTADEVKLLLG
jgi:hypothetical protein